MVLVMQLIILRNNDCLPARWHKASLWEVTKSCLTLYICFYWLSTPPPAPGSRWDFLSIRLPSRKYLTLGQPWADSQELWWKSTAGTVRRSDAAVTSKRPVRTACVLCVLPGPSVPGDWRCQPQVQMVEMGLISLGMYLEKNHLLVISRYLQCQDRTCSRLHPSCLLCSTAFFDASPYHTFIV